MIWEVIAGGIKGFADTVLGFVKEFHMAPEEAAKLEAQVRQSQMDFERQMWDLESKDRDSARRREVETRDPTTHRLAYLYTAGYFCALFAAWHWGIPVDGHDTFVTLMAVLTAAQMSIISYYFGSSHGSAAQRETIDRVVNHKEPVIQLAGPQGKAGKDGKDGKEGKDGTDGV